MSSPTLALLRKDRPWLLGFLAVGGGLSTLVFLAHGFSDVFVVAEHRFAEDFELLLAPLSILLGLCSTLIDDLQSTRDFLRHRPLTSARLFWTRNIAALVVIAAWMAIGAASTWLHESAFGLGGACADSSRFGALAAMAAGLALNHALVSFAFALPARWWHRTWLAVLLVFSRYAAQSLLGPEDPPALTCALLLALGTLAFLLAAARCESTGHDPDRPTPGRALVGSVGLTLVAASLFGAMAANGWQELALRGLQRVRPCVGRIGPGELGFLTAPDEYGLCAVLDPEGSPTDRRIPFDSANRAAPRFADPGLDPFGIPALYPPFAWYQGEAGSPFRRRLQIRTDALRVVEEREHSRTCWLLSLPEGSTTSKGAAFAELDDGEEEPLFFFAPEIAGLWLVTDETPPRLVARPLPESERPRGMSYWEDEAGKSHRGVAGETHTWRYSSDAWETARVPASVQEVTSAVLDYDALRPEIELNLRDGPSLRHRYGLERVSEKLLAGIAVSSVFLRPTPFALLSAQTDYSAVAEAKPDEALLVLDPLLGGGYRWLLVPNLALTALLMALMFRDLRRRGASRRRTVCWTLAVFCAGVFTGPLLLALEPRRAWRRPAQGTPPAMLIHAA